LFRRPLDLLVATTYPADAAYKLTLMGASVIELHHLEVEPTIKHDARVADAIVIETKNGNPLSGSGVLEAVNLAKQIRRLPDYFSMPNGARWNGIPIAVVVDDQRTADAMAADPELKFIIPCSLRRFDLLNYYEYIDPWLEIYRRIDEAALANAQARMDQMQSVGHRFQVIDGRWIRLVPPPTKRQHGSRPELETQLYSGSADRLIRRTREVEASWDGRDVVLLERAAVEIDLDRYEHLVDRPHIELEVQRFYGQRPYMLGSGAFETTAHPQFRPAGASRPTPPDFVQHSYNRAIVPKPARIVELKNNSSKLLTKTGTDWHWARTVTGALAQVRRYAEHATARQYRLQMEALLGEAPKRVEKLLIAGRADRYDPERLDRARKHEKDVEVRGHDEMLGISHGRYGSKDIASSPGLQLPWQKKRQIRPRFDVSP
jgi:hypothetical protein